LASHQDPGSLETTEMAFEKLNTQSRSWNSWVRLSSEEKYHMSWITSTVILLQDFSQNTSMQIFRTTKVAQKLGNEGN
jgi:hypothetical protein